MVVQYYVDIVESPAHNELLSVASFTSDILGSFTRIFNKGFGSKASPKFVARPVPVERWTRDNGTMMTALSTIL